MAKPGQVMQRKTSYASTRLLEDCLEDGMVVPARGTRLARKQEEMEVEWEAKVAFDLFTHAICNT